MERHMVLCIDDEPMVLVTRKLVLQSAGFGVLTAKDVHNAMRLFASRNVDAVVLGQFRAGIDGGAVAAAMKRLRPSVPIMMLTPHGATEETLDGVDALLTQDEGPAAILGTLHSLVCAAQP